MTGELDAIGAKAKEALATAEGSVLVSAVVIWEVAIKRGLGKLDAPPDLLEQIEQAGVDLLPITARHADRVGMLPMHHRDPFDRLLIAQAQIEEVSLVSADSQLSRYGVDLIW
jgi:PIN domain nuclease of toxin-antitoxin system